jgi:uncharacterized protein YjbI with pentapeptide repeats
MKDIKYQIGSIIRPRWDKLGKYGRSAFFALLAYPIIVLLHHFIFPHIALFLIKKAIWEVVAVFVLFTFCIGIITIFYLTRALYHLAILIRRFLQVSIKFTKIFYYSTTKKFKDKDQTDHSFRTVDAILKYFGVVATFAAGVGFMVNYISSQETAKIDREKMLNELFYKAVEQVGSKDADVNLAGIYSLEQSAINFPRNQWKVVGLLANYIRQHPPSFDEPKLLGRLRKEEREKYDKKYKTKYPNKPMDKEVANKLYKPIDKEAEKTLLQKWKYEHKSSLAPYKKIDIRVQAALGVICRRKLEYDKDLFESIHDKYKEIDTDRKDNIISYSDISPNRIIDLDTNRDHSSILSDLSNYDMSGCNFHRVSLNRATLDNANMTNADLSKGYLIDSSFISSNLVAADVERSQLKRANLSSADLRQARMKQTKLTMANLTGANLSSADLRQARMKETKLTMANLTGTNLSDAYDLSKDQIREACYWKKAMFNPQQEKELEINLSIESSERQECKDKWEPK